jgi:hypothetical protein
VADVAGLQAAIAAVNSDPSKHAVISLAPGTYDLTNELLVTHARDLTIQRDSAGPVVIDNPTHSDRIFEIDGGDVTLDGLAISGGSANFGGGISAGYTTLTVSNSTISGNSADGYASSGGGVLLQGGTLTVSNSTISGNSADGYASSGGGIEAGGTLTVSNSTISGNSAVGGGGIFTSDSSLAVTNSTISGNSVSSVQPSLGGGIYSYNSVVEIANSTLNDPQGGGIFAWGPSTVHLKGTVVDGVLYVDQFWP